MSTATAIKPPSLESVFQLANVSQLQVHYYNAPNRGYDLMGRVIGIDWEETKDSPCRQFTLALDNDAGRLSFVKEGGVLVLQCGPVPPHGWIEWFRGAVINVDTVHSATDTSMQIVAKDLMRNLARSNGNFTFPNGKTASQHIEHLVSRLQIPIGYIAPTEKILQGFTFNGSFSDAINILLERTVKAGGLRFVPEFADGKFWLVFYARPDWGYGVDDVLVSIQRSRSIDNVITRMILHTKEHYTVTVPGKARKSTKTSSASTANIDPSLLLGGGAAAKKAAAPKPHTAKKTRVVAQIIEAPPEIMEAYGVVQTIVEENTVSPQDLKEAARTRLAKYVKPEDVLTAELASSALTLRRLQAVQFDDATYSGATGEYVIDSLSGHLGGDAATLSLTLARKPLFPDAPLDSTQPLGKDKHYFTTTAGQDQVVQAIMASCDKFQIQDKALMVAVAMEESGLNPYNSGGGAIGIFQLQPGGALGSLTRVQALDPSTNADVVCELFAKVGGKTASGKAGLLLYYVNVGRGASNTIPTERAWALYPQAQALVKANS